MSGWRAWLRVKNIDALKAEADAPERRLKKSLGWASLTALGIGAVIGSGIFTVIGTAIAGEHFEASSILNAPLLEYLIHHSASFGRPGAGPAIALSFLLVAVVCGFAALCYAELATMIPIAGSAYTYTYATLGELVAWILGWNLILEYAVSNMAVSVGFSAHVVSLLDWFGWHPDARWISPAYLPGGLAGGSVIFFTYIGFDSVSTAAEECRDPQRDLPIGIIATLVICAVLYIAVAVVLTGLVPWRSLLDDAAPVVNTLKKLNLEGVRLAVLLGALIGMISSLLVFQLGQARVWFAMSRDGLLPRAFGRVHPRFRTPAFSTWVAGFAVGIPAGLFDIGTLADLSNIGTLFAFALVAVGVLVLRRREPERRRHFRAPGGPLAPVVTILACLLLMAGLSLTSWLRFFVWLVIGLSIYF